MQVYLRIKEHINLYEREHVRIIKLWLQEIGSALQNKFDIFHMHPSKWGIEGFLNRIPKLINDQDQIEWTDEIGNEIQLE